MEVSDNALDILRKFEAGPNGGPALEVYTCPAGVPTIGWGHALKPGEKFGVISAQEADILLSKDLSAFVRAVSKSLEGVPTTQNQFDAMVCLAFNIGADAFARSTLLRMHIAGKRLPIEYRPEEFVMLSRTKKIPHNAPDQFLAWAFGGGKWLKGLWNRRWDERKLYLNRV